LYYFQNVLQTPPPNTGLTLRLHSANVVRPQRAHGVVLGHVQNNPAPWHTRQWHSAYTALLATAQRASRCGKSVRTPLWCDRGLNHCAKQSGLKMQT